MTKIDGFLDFRPLWGSLLNALSQWWDKTKLPNDNWIHAKSCVWQMDSKFTMGGRTGEGVRCNPTAKDNLNTSVSTNTTHCKGELKRMQISAS